MQVDYEIKVPGYKVDVDAAGEIDFQTSVSKYGGYITFTAEDLMDIVAYSKRHVEAYAAYKESGFHDAIYWDTFEATE